MTSQLFWPIKNSYRIDLLVSHSSGAVAVVGLFVVIFFLFVFDKPDVSNELHHGNQFDILSCATGPAQSGILFDREVVNLFLHFTVNPKPRVEYIDRPRCSLRGKECSISRFQQVESRWGYSGTSDRIR